MTTTGRRGTQRGMALDDGGVWSVHLLRDDQAFNGLADEWRDLYERCPTATPFQSHGWLHGWWHAYGLAGRLRLFIVRKHGKLVAAAPLMLQRRWGFPILTPIGSQLADFDDVLIDPQDSETSLRLLRDALLGDRGWCALDLPQVRPGAAVTKLLQCWPARTSRIPAATCLELDAASINDILRRLPTRTAGKMRAKLRKINAQEFSTTRIRPDVAKDAVSRLLNLHRQQWQGRGISHEHKGRKFHELLGHAIPPMIKHDQAMIIEYHKGGALVASDLLMIGHDFIGAYLYGTRPDLRQNVDVALLLLQQDLRITQALDRRVLSMLRGEEPYKMKFRPRTVRNERLVLSRSVAGRGYSAALRMRRRTVTLIRSRRRAGAHRAGGSGLRSEQQVGE